MLLASHPTGILSAGTRPENGSMTASAMVATAAMQPAGFNSGRSTLGLRENYKSLAGALVVVCKIGLANLVVRRRTDPQAAWRVSGRIAPEHRLGFPVYFSA